MHTHIADDKAPRLQSSGKGTFLGKMFPEDSQTEPHSHLSPRLSAYTIHPAIDTSILPEKMLESSTQKLIQKINDTTNFPIQQQTVDPLEGSDFWSFLCGYNDTLCMYNSSTPSNTTFEAEIKQHKYWTMFLLLFPLFTVFGNVLVVLSVWRERNLRTVTNYFICSLAVADVLVAILVMPPAVYMEVTGFWMLSEFLCDAWVASDVMACTASILNLTAICVDRFIAVTQPIKYSKHKNSKRVYVMLALTWIISLAIAAPIALGVNYSHLRKKGDCTFFNSDFLIYSSMGSFYIPSLIMIFLYWKIYRVLRLRAKKKMAHKPKGAKAPNFSTVIENTATVARVEPTVTTGLATCMDNGRISSYNTTKGDNTLNVQVPIIDEPSVSNVPTNTDSHSQDPEEGADESSGTLPKSPGSDETKGGELIMNPVAAEHERLEAQENKYTVTPTVEIETKFSDTTPTKQLTLPKKDNDRTRKNGTSRKKEKKAVTKFNFHMRTSRKRKERSSSRKEKKATKTLAIVLGVFLFCWWPFFTINIINAFCLRFELFEYSACTIHPMLFSFFVWLGYINSFLNPAIYTIFNPEFRKAFRKILTDRCKY